MISDSIKEVVFEATKELKRLSFDAGNSALAFKLHELIELALEVEADLESRSRAPSAIG